MNLLVSLLLPMVVSYVRHHEAIILQNGEPLTPGQQIDAHKIGIKNIQQVRVMKVDRMPWPEQKVLQQFAKWAGLMVGNASGVTFGHGIYIRKNYWGIRSLLVHELTHTMQYERLGGIRPFLKQYLTECLVKGYYNSPLEREAVEMEQKFR